MKRRMLWAGIAAVWLAAAGSVRADGEAAKVPQAPQQFVRASMESTDRAKELLTAWAIPGVPADIAGMIEKVFPFMGAGAIDGSKPIGILYLAADGKPSKELVVFVLPVNKEKGTVADLTAAGGTAVAGHEDMVQMAGEVAFKRTADYLFMYPGDPAVIAGMTNDVLAKDFAEKGTLLRANVDLRIARAAAPEGYRAFIENMFANARHDVGGELAKKYMTQCIDGINALNMTVKLDDKELSTAWTISPSPVKGQREFARPIFAPEAILRADIAYPDAVSAEWLAESLRQAVTMGLFNDHRDTRQQKAAAAEVMASLGALATGDAQSVAVESENGEVTVTVVNQYDRDVNVPAELKKDLQFAEDLGRAWGSRPEIATEDWKGPDGTVGLRIRSAKPGGPSILVTQRGHMAVAVISSKEVAGPPAVSLSATEKFSDLLSARVDIGAAMKALDASPLAKQIPDEMRKTWLEKFAGKEWTLTVVNNADGTLSVITRVPANMLQAMFQAMARETSRDATAQPAGAQ